MTEVDEIIEMKVTSLIKYCLDHERPVVLLASMTDRVQGGMFGSQIQIANLMMVLIDTYAKGEGMELEKEGDTEKRLEDLARSIMEGLNNLNRET